MGQAMTVKTFSLDGCEQTTALLAVVKYRNIALENNSLQRRFTFLYNGDLPLRNSITYVIIVNYKRKQYMT